MKKFILIPFSLIILAGIVMLGGNCKKVMLVQSTTSDPNILEYLQKDSLQRFTRLVTVIGKAGFNSAMNTYGTYTLFAPTDSAINLYLKQLNLASVDQVPDTVWASVLKFHLLEEEVITSQFNDGKLPSVTMFGQYLITGVSNEGGISSYTVNRQAKVTQQNVTLGNGIVHVIDHVLTPSTSTLAKMIEQNPDYSIFLQALKETGYYDTLNTTVNTDGSHRWLTLLAQPNKAFNDTGIVSYAALKTKYCNTGDPKNPLDSLHLFVAYHILYDVKYLADIVIASSHQTLAPLEVITDKLVNNSQVLINDDSYTTITGTVHEPGVGLDPLNSDVSATNGVMHRIQGHLAIKVRQPFPVYWDLCSTQPELTRLSSVYRKKTYLFDYGDSTTPTFKGIKWEKSCLKYRAGVQGYLGDYWEMGLGTSSSNTDNLGKCDANSWISFTTPLLVKGKYKVWFCYYVQNSTVSATQVSFDSIPLTSALISFQQKISSIDPAQEATLAAIGWKWWAGAAKKSGSTSGRMVGIIDVKQTGQHTIRFDLVSGTNSDCNFDMVHFIPVNMNQTSPRFNPDGSIEY